MTTDQQIASAKRELLASLTTVPIAFVLLCQHSQFSARVLRMAVSALELEARIAWHDPHTIIRLYA